ncbi:hypothetical protein ACHAP3_011058 [Botrytis cinerea]
MTVYCALCNRSFNGQRELDQHVRDSSAHKKLKVQLPRVKQQKQVASNQVQSAKAQALSIHTSTKRQRGQPPITTASSFSTSNITRPVIANNPRVVNSSWSVVAESEYTTVLNELSTHCHSPMDLKENGYILDPFNPLDYVNSRKCTRCNSQETNAIGRECNFHPRKRNKWIEKKPYKCCGTKGKGCRTSPTHDFQLSLRAIKHKDFRKTPAASGEPKFRAVTVDCEMAGTSGGTGEVVMLCVIDYITGAVLLHRFVCPREKITQMRSSIHGISKSTLDNANLQGQALSGWEGARSELWKYIDDHTILVGHALQHDLDALRIIHPRIVDSGILSRNAVGIRRIQWGLQTLCSELLNIKIRNKKGGIHDCFEDVLATRDVVLSCTRDKRAFQTWAERKRSEELHLQKERERMRQEKEDERARKDLLRVGGGSSNRICLSSNDEDEEILRWSDIAEDLGWPHPDTGYDPWSD